MLNNKHKNWFKKFEKVKFNEPMSKHTTLGIGGKVEIFVKANTKSDLLKLFRYCKKHDLKFLVIGSGSNLLVNDTDLDLVVIQNDYKKLDNKNNRIVASAGVQLNDLVDYANKLSLAGLEMLAGIPGTVGGAVYGNAGAYGQSISDHLVSVDIVENNVLQNITKTKCGFSYRYSNFKQTKPLILNVEFELPNGNSEELIQKSADIRAVRYEKYPPSLKCPGSFYKNILAREVDKKLLLNIPVDKVVHGKIPAGYLLETVGAKGASLGKIKVADYHANLFVNRGHGKARDFLNLAEKYNDKVQERFGIRLEPEVQPIGFNNYGIIGFGIEGQDTARYLKNLGAQVTVFDRKEKNEIQLPEDLSEIKFVCGPDYLNSKELGKQDKIFRSAGVYPLQPELKDIRKTNKLSSVINLFFEHCPAKIIGVTGTKGKGTTSTLIYEIVKKSKKNVYLAGNIGIPYLQLLPKLKPEDWVILELSSFQLMDLGKSPHLAVVLNISSDHLDWHKNIRQYRSAKENIVRHQANEDLAVINYDYSNSKKFAKLTKANVFYFSKKHKVKGAYIRGNQLYLNTKNIREKIMKTSDFRLIGKHNWENILAAVLASGLLGCSNTNIKSVIEKFSGLPHRLELIRKFNDITFYNDSFSTNPEPTIAAIKSFNEPITLILGGFDKGLNYEKMCKQISKRRVNNIILIGDLSTKLAKLLKKSGFKGQLYKLGKVDMKDIVKMSFLTTDKDGVVIFSPAAASFDMFENYKDRGNQFKKEVKALSAKIK